MSVRRMTEPEAWREIARRIAEGKWSKKGLCEEIDDLFDKGHISGFVHSGMEDRISLHLNAHGSHFWAYKQGAEPEARTLAALWMALEAEKEVGRE